MTVAPVTISALSHREESTLIQSNIQSVALRIFYELATTFAFGIVCLPFLGTTAAATTLFSVTLACAGIESILIIASRIFQGKNVKAFLERFAVLIFSSSTSNIRNLIHESGHFVAAKMLFKGFPKIRLIPFHGGYTQFSSKTLTHFGSFLGYRRSIFALTIAGSAIQALAASVCLAVGLVERPSHPTLSLYLVGLSLTAFYSIADYASSALTTTSQDLAHDFIRLKTLGLHPAVALAAIVAVPVILILGFILANRNECIP